MVEVKKGQILYFGHDPEDARAYIKRFKLTPEKVKFVKREGDTIIEAKKGFNL